MDCPADQAFIQYLDYDLYAVGGIMQGLVICSASPLPFDANDIVR